MIYFKENAKWYFLCQCKPPSYKHLLVLIVSHLLNIKNTFQMTTSNAIK